VLSRVLALVVAVGLVVGALAIRARLDGGDGVTVTLGRDASGAVICATEVAQACRDLAERSDGDLTVRVEEAGVTLDALGSADPPTADAWVTLQPWPEMARERRRRAGLEALVEEDSVTLARSTMVLAMWEERAEALAPTCDPVTWRCVGEAAGGTWADVGGRDTWGPVKPGHGDPSRSASGLLALHQAAASRIGTTSYSARDLDDPAFFSWFSTLQRAVPDFRPSSGSPLLAMVQFGPASYDVVGAVEAEVLGLRDRAAGRAGGLMVVPGDPPTGVGVVVVGIGGDDGVAARVAEELPELLTESNWQTGADGDTTVPAAGVLEALRREWSEVMR
jgi:hypothetical protein